MTGPVPGKDEERRLQQLEIEQSLLAAWSSTPPEDIDEDTEEDTQA